MSKNATKKKTEVVEDEFESLEGDDLSLDEGLNENEDSELEEGLNEGETKGEDELTETLDEIEEPASTKKPAAKKTEPAPTKKPSAKKTEPVEETTEEDVTLDEGDSVEELEETTEEIEEEPTAPKPTVKKTEKKTEKSEKKEETPKKQKTEEYIAKYGGEYFEEFEMKKIKLGKYEIRETQRSPEKITELADDIRSRGQLEPVHVVLEGKEYHLIAGYHRYLALKELKSDTIRTIVYKNLNVSQIQAIATGTNAIRTDLSEWDKICSVAKYHEANPDIPIFVKQENVTTICSVFGYKKTRIYEYINVYDFLKNFENTDLLDFVKSANLPIHYLTGLYNLREHIKPSDTDAIIKLFKERPDLRIKEFDVEFTAYLNEVHMSNDPDASTDEELDEGDVDIPTDGKKKNTQEKIDDALNGDDENDESKELSRNIKKKTNECINKLTEVHTILTELTQYDDLKELVEEKITKVLIKRATEISKLSSKLFN